MKQAVQLVVGVLGKRPILSECTLIVIGCSRLQLLKWIEEIKVIHPEQLRPQRILLKYLTSGIMYIFTGFGNVVELRINTKGVGGKLPNFGFVVFDDSEPVQRILIAKVSDLQGIIQDNSSLYYSCCI